MFVNKKKHLVLPKLLCKLIFPSEANTVARFISSKILKPQWGNLKAYFDIIL